MMNGGRFENLTLKAEDLSEGVLGSTFVNCVFDDCDLKGVPFLNATLRGCAIQKSFWDRVDMSTCTIEDLHLVHFKMKRVLFPDDLMPTFGDSVTRRAFAISRGSLGVKRKKKS